MGLVKTGRRLAEDGSPHRAGAEMLPNYRTVLRQTTERLLRGIGYFDIMFAIWQKTTESRVMRLMRS